MDGGKWPAIAIEGILLGTTVAFIAAGRDNLWMTVSLAILLFILGVQGISRNTRFLYLYPVNVKTGVPTPGVDTWILRLSIITAVHFLFWGVTDSWKAALGIVSAATATGIIWDLFCNDPHQKWVNNRANGQSSKQPSPNKSFQADPDPRERGSGPLNSSR